MNLQRISTMSLILIPFLSLMGCGEGYESHYKVVQLGPSLLSENPGLNGTPLPPDRPSEEGEEPTLPPIGFDDPCTTQLDVDPSSQIRIQAACRTTNWEREDESLSLLTLDVERSRVAQAHAEEMVNLGYFSHIDARGENFRDRLLNAGVNFDFGGENIAYGTVLGQEVVTLWMGSGIHRRNILNATYTRVGLGYYKEYWVQILTD